MCVLKSFHLGLRLHSNDSVKCENGKKWENQTGSQTKHFMMTNDN